MVRRLFPAVPRQGGFYPACALVLAGLSGGAALGQEEPIEKFDQPDRFRQLEESLPTPNDQRAASGAPGHAYWQQKVDYAIEVALDDDTHRITGSERITYTNHSPDELRYLWLQLDANIYAPGADAVLIQTAPDLDDPSPRAIKRLLARRSFDGSIDIRRVEDGDGRTLDYTIVKTMMRVDLRDALQPGGKQVLAIDWSYIMNDADAVGGRTSYEYFPEDGNCIYEVAQWFPRLCQYTDTRGWHNKQFLGRGEFSLEFGDYLVRITVPDDHVVASTGVLQNPASVLTEGQIERLDQAAHAEEPMFIVTPDEAKANESSKPGGTKTWIFAAENVRDFAWATSRKFIWDAVRHDVGNQQVWCMSYYPNEGEPLWSRYSTHAIIHTLDVYSKFTFDYPYPTAISVNGPVGGMEYPMICFNGPRPEEDGTYSKRTKYGLISVIIHEVGHNFFPMIVNSDERQWTWMDEGLNTFMQFLAEQEWEPDYPSRRGEARNIVGYMGSADQVPIMTNSESLLQFGANAYAKPATALNILRETILGRELFDFAFAEYSRRWMFRNPMPADFFRTMEDASGVDLDWFWRGWFYSTDHTDLGITGLRVHRMRSSDLESEAALDKTDRDDDPVSVTELRNADLPKRSDRFPDLLDFYNEYDELDVSPEDRRRYERFLKRLEDDEADYIDLDVLFYVVSFENVGGLVMPLILQIDYVDGSSEEMRIPAEIWARDGEYVSKLLIAEHEIAKITLDPHLETADVDLSNNAWPPEPVESRFRMFKRRQQRNPMQELESKPTESELEAEADEEEDARRRRGR